MLYINLMVTANQIQLIDTHTKKRMKSKDSTKDMQKIMEIEENKERGEKKKRKKRTQNNLKTTKLKISIYLSIISLNINGLNDPIKNSNWKRRNKTITVGKKKRKRKNRD